MYEAGALFEGCDDLSSPYDGSSAHLTSEEKHRSPCEPVRSNR